jgi:hypothetical protein
MAGYVYLIGSPLFHWYKIGKSSNAAIRVTDLGVLLPFRIEVIAIWKVPNHHEWERILHERFRSKNLNGEWFVFDEEEIRSIVAEMAWAATKTIADFTNMDRDFAPPGLQPNFQYSTILTPEQRAHFKKAKKNHKLVRSVDFTDSERAARKAEAIANRRAAEEKLKSKNWHYKKFLTIQ